MRLGFGKPARTAGRLDAPPGPRPPARTRLMRRSDLFDVLRIENVGFSNPWPAAAFEIAIVDPALLALLAHVEGTPVGYVVASRERRSVLIANVAVDRRHRRRGIARQLMGAAIAWGGTAGAERCVLDVRRSNKAALALYHSMGFRDTGSRRRYYSDPVEDAVSMERPIRNPFRSAELRG